MRDHEKFVAIVTLICALTILFFIIISLFIISYLYNQETHFKISERECHNETIESSCSMVCDCKYVNFSCELTDSAYSNLSEEKRIEWEIKDKRVNFDENTTYGDIINFVFNNICIGGSVNYDQFCLPLIEEKEVCVNKEVNEIKLDRWERINTENCGVIECSNECTFEGDNKSTNPFKNPKTREECKIINQEFFYKEKKLKKDITKEWLDKNCNCPCNGNLCAEINPKLGKINVDGCTKYQCQLGDKTYLVEAWNQIK
jgi:hypothetical protein